MNQSLNLRPFTYIYGGRFTNRKHRIVTGTLRLMADSDFLLHSVSGYGDAIVEGQFSVDIRDVEGFPCIRAKELNTLPQAIVPSIPFRSMGQLLITAKLKDGVNVGRRRPYFQIACLGFKVFKGLPDLRESLKSLIKPED